MSRLAAYMSCGFSLDLGVAYKTNQRQSTPCPTLKFAPVLFLFSARCAAGAQETAPRQIGTTVSIASMFEPLPVRRGEFRRNIKKQFNKLLRGMQAYALISLGVRITVTNTKAKGGRQTHIGTQVGSAS